MVGLDGTGDKNQVNLPTRPSPICCASLACSCRKNRPEGEKRRRSGGERHIAAMYSRGQTIDVTVSSIGDAKRFAAALYCLRSCTARMAKYMPGTGQRGGGRDERHRGQRFQVTVNTPTAGLIPNGATVERESPAIFRWATPSPST